jgi:putative heme-binding domain-containing protein
MALQERLQMDFYRGGDRGRIFRIVPENPRREGDLKPNLGQASTGELIETLSHRNGWHRRTAHRLLIEQQDQAAVPLLAKLAEESDFPQARLHALWALEGLGALEAPLVKKALADEHPRIRENAIKMAEAFLPELSRSLMDLMDDSDPRVRFQFILTLGLVPGRHRALAQLTNELAEDRWFRDALLCSVGNTGMRVLDRLLSRYRGFFAEPSEGKQEFISHLVSGIAARRDSREISLFLITLDGSPQLRPAAWKQAALEGLAEGLHLEAKKRVSIPSARRVMMSLINDPSEEVSLAAREAAQYFALPAFIRQSLREAADGELAIEKRVLAVQALRGARYAQADPVLKDVLTTPTPQPVQEAAVATLSEFDEAGVADTLLSGWGGYGPPVRERVAQAMMRKGERAEALLNAVEDGRIPASTIDAVSKIRLTQYPDDAVRERAGKLLAAEVSDRATVIEQHQDVLELAGNVDRGREVFKESCSKCHMRQGERARIGPDLSGVNNKTRDELLESILDPSGDIQPNYANYILVDKTGRIYDGLLAGETAEAVKLRGEYEDITVLRKNIAEMRTSTVSLMPDGLEEDMSRQNLADVIEYLRAGL